jgi:SAM-dependent methyltransferase
MGLLGIIRSVLPAGIRESLKDNLGITALQERNSQVERLLTQTQGRLSSLGDVNIQLETDVVFLQERIDQLEERLYQSCEVTNNLEIARGNIDNVVYEDEMLTIEGWMLIPQRDFDSIAIYIDNEKMGESEIHERGDVAKRYHFLSNAGNSGFRFQIQRNPEDMREMIDISAVGISNGREVAKTDFCYQVDLDSCLPIPPDSLLKNVGALNRPWYLSFGMRTFREFWTTARKYADSRSFNSMLDWGCGCGRVTGFFQEFSGISEIHGCDIDPKAIDWCNENLKLAEFSLAPLYPPTPYPDNKFDLVISHSVLTHLSKEDQLTWLEEMQRILAPGGLFLATVHGKFATMLKFPGKKSKEILKNGICDEDICGHAEGVCPEEYYRYTYQTKAYSIKEYSRFFDVLDYIEKGAIGIQDLIVMRKREPRH